MFYGRGEWERVKELPTDSPYKPCLNKPLPPTSFHWLNRGRAGIYSSVPVIWWWLPRLSAPPPLPHPFMPAAAASLQLSWLLLSLCSIYTSRYDFWGIVKQLLANSCSSLISARHWRRGTGRESLHTELGIFIQKCCTCSLKFSHQSTHQVWNCCKSYSK